MPIDSIIVLDFEATCDEGEEETLTRLQQTDVHEIIELCVRPPWETLRTVR